MSEHDDKIDNIIKQIDEYGSKFLRLQFSDIHGIPKSMAVSLKKPDDAEDIINNGLLFDGSSVAGFVDINNSDLALKPDITTFSTLPWRHVGLFVTFIIQMELLLKVILEEC